MAKVIPNNEAVSRFKILSLLSALFSLAGFVTFWWSGLIGFALGLMAISISKHDAVKALNAKLGYLVAMYVGLVLGFVNIIVFNM